MNMKKFFILQIAIGALAGLVMFITNMMQLAGFVTTEAGLTFVTFIAWSCYFFSGSTPKDALISWCSFVVGIICAIIIFVCNTFLSGLGIPTMYVALPLAVVVGVMLMDYAEKLPFGNRVSAIYLGAATFFGMMGIPSVAAQGYLVVGIAELVYAALGLVAGYMTIVIMDKFATHKVAA